MYVIKTLTWQKQTVYINTYIHHMYELREQFRTQTTSENTGKPQHVATLI